MCVLLPFYSSLFSPVSPVFPRDSLPVNNRSLKNKIDHTQNRCQRLRNVGRFRTERAHNDHSWAQPDRTTHLHKIQHHSSPGIQLKWWCSTKNRPIIDALCISRCVLRRWKKFTSELRASSFLFLTSKFSVRSTATTTVVAHLSLTLAADPSLVKYEVNRQRRTLCVCGTT